MGIEGVLALFRPAAAIDIPGAWLSRDLVRRGRFTARMAEELLAFEPQSEPAPNEVIMAWS